MVREVVEVGRRSSTSVLICVDLGHDTSGMERLTPQPTPGRPSRSMVEAGPAWRFNGVPIARNSEPRHGPRVVY